MGSVFPHFEGTKWWRLGYDSFDFSVCFNYLGIRKWRVHRKREHIIVYAATIEAAKAEASDKRHWPLHEIDCVNMLHH